MINLSLEESQVRMLIDILERTLADLSYEIGNTATYDFKEQLKERRIELNKILEIFQASL